MQLFYSEYYMNAINQICDAHLTNGIANQGENISNAFDLIDALATAMPQFNETYFDCKWRNSLVPCGNIFRRFVTEEGLCYSFNSLSPEEIYRRDG